MLTMIRYGWLPLFFLFCCKTFSMDLAQKNEIISFNVGGYCFKFTRQTIVNFGGDLLNKLIENNIPVIKDEQNNIFIDRSIEEGKLIETFIHTQFLPVLFDQNIASGAADFFGIKAMREYINLHSPKIYYKKVSCGSHFMHKACCPECNEPFYYSSKLEAVEHLIFKHGVHIEYYKKEKHRDMWHILYSVISTPENNRIERDLKQQRQEKTIPSLENKWHSGIPADSNLHFYSTPPSHIPFYSWMNLSNQAVTWYGSAEK